MRSSALRGSKYKAKLDGNIAKLRVQRDRAKQASKFGTSISKQVEIELWVKRMVSGAGNHLLLPYYIIFTKEAHALGRKHSGDILYTELEILQEKWRMRGLDLPLMDSMKQVLFPGYTPIGNIFRCDMSLLDGPDVLG